MCITPQSVTLRGVHSTKESEFLVCSILRSLTPWRAFHYHAFVSGRGGFESWEEIEVKNLMIRSLLRFKQLYLIKSKTINFYSVVGGFRDRVKAVYSVIT